jgi:hypothetical protein
MPGVKGALEELIDNALNATLRRRLHKQKPTIWVEFFDHADDAQAMLVVMDNGVRPRCRGSGSAVHGAKVSAASRRPKPVRPGLNLLWMPALLLQLIAVLLLLPAFPAGPDTCASAACAPAWCTRRITPPSGAALPTPQVGMSADVLKKYLKEGATFSHLPNLPRSECAADDAAHGRAAGGAGQGGTGRDSCMTLVSVQES